jgi:hypothetical protein
MGLDTYDAYTAKTYVHLICFLANHQIASYRRLRSSIFDVKKEIIQVIVGVKNRAFE